MELLCAKSKKFLPKYIYPLHKHKNVEVLYVKSGICFLQIEEDKVVLNKGDSLLINANINHNFIVGNAKNCIINHLELIINNEIFIENFNGYVKLLNCDIINDILDIINKCNNDEKYENVRDILIKSQFELLVEIFCKTKSNEYRKNSTHPIVEKISNIIQENFLDAISLESIAEECGYSSRYIRKIFQQYYGMSPNSYLTMLRIEYSKILLSNGKMNISEIAINSGFNTVQYFSKIFKKNVGILPSDLKQLTLKESKKEDEE